MTKLLELNTSWLKRLKGTNWKSLYLTKEALHWDDQSLPISTLTTPPLLSEADKQADLLLTVEQGTKVELSSLPLDEARQLVEQINLLRYPILSEEVSRSATTIQQGIPRGRYPQVAELKALQQQAAAATQPFVEPPSEAHFENTFCKPFVYLHSWAHASDEQLQKVQQRYIDAEIGRYQPLFEQIESNPLTDAQRTACVTCEKNNLVVAGAGTGKTSTLVGRAGYLMASNRAQPGQILMLAFARKAADEMRERLNSRLGPDADGIASFTFHALGRTIIQQVEGQQPAITLMAEDANTRRSWVEECFTHLLSHDDNYQQRALHYFAHYLYPGRDPFEFRSEGEQKQYLLDNRISSLKGEAMASLPEALLANWLFRNGIEYCYQHRYQPQQYRPDYRYYEATFYLPELDAWIDYLPRNSAGEAPGWMDQTEAEAYWQWLEAFHTQQDNQWFSTDYQQWKQGTLITNLADWLLKLGVEPDPLPGKAVLDTLAETGATQQMAELLHEMLGRARGGRFDRTGFEALIENAAEPDRMKAALDLLQPILGAYQQALDDAGQIDFDDMINRAIEHVRSGRFRSPWTEIMVDEFQDISRPRAELIHALRDQVSNASLFCVGDDWQAIYRFAGSDLGLTTGFAEQFGDTAITVLDKTFRFNDSICDVASQFVMANPDQIRKQLVTHAKVDYPAVSLLRSGYSRKTRLEPVRKALRAISLQALPGSSVYLLGRYLHNLPDRSELEQLRGEFTSLQIQALTMHASKGKEADYAVIVELVSGRNGFPSQKESHPLLEAMLPGLDRYDHAEERRLFYVAITRARHRAILITDMTRPSGFIEEMLEGDYKLDLDSFPSSLSQRLGLVPECPKCRQGTLLERQGRRGSFYGCSRYPACDHSEPACGFCGAPMENDPDEHVRTCQNPDCSHTEPSCPSCNSAMSLREGRNGEFWGCTAYRANDPDSCKTTVPA